MGTRVNKESIISCCNISKCYRTVEALKNISFSIEQNDKVAFVGANGAGKSTLFNVILGLTSIDAGTSKLFGEETRLLKPEHRERISLISDTAGPLPWASSNDIGKFYASIYRNWDQNRFVELLNSWGIEENRRLNCLSKGQKRLAEFALIIACQPEVIILDEPFDGLDAVMRIQVQRLLNQINKDKGTTLIFSSHILSEISKIANRVVILRKGEIVCDISLNKLEEPLETLFSRLYKKDLE